MVPEKGVVTLISLKLTVTLKQKTGMREIATTFLVLLFFLCLEHWGTMWGDFSTL
jgi:hypothetical protein